MAWLNLFFYFLLYSFIGWLGEVVYAFYVHRHFVNRGFLNGPLCPIYGVGALIFVGLGRIITQPIPLFFIAAISATLLEFLTGFLLKTIFHRRYWDYSHSFLNVCGYISLGGTLVWGIAGVLTVHVLHPLVLGLVNLIPHTLLHVLSFFFFFIFVFDVVVTINQNLKLSKRLQSLKQMAETLLEEHSQERNYKKLDKEYQRASYIQSYGERRIIQAFPNLKSKPYDQALQAIYRTQDKIKNQFDQAKKAYRKNMNEAKENYLNWKKDNQMEKAAKEIKEQKKQYHVNMKQLKIEYRRLKKRIRENPHFSRFNQD